MLSVSRWRQQLIPAPFRALWLRGYSPAGRWSGQPLQGSVASCAACDAGEPCRFAVVRFALRAASCTSLLPCSHLPRCVSPAFHSPSALSGYWCPTGSTNGTLTRCVLLARGPPFVVFASLAHLLIHLPFDLTPADDSVRVLLRALCQVSGRILVVSSCSLFLHFALLSHSFCSHRHRYIRSHRVRFSCLISLFPARPSPLS